MYRLIFKLLAAATVLSLLVGCATEPSPAPIPPEPYLAGAKPWVPPDTATLPLAETPSNEVPANPEPDAEPSTESSPEVASKPDGDTFVGPPAPHERQGPGKLTIRLKSQRFEYREGGELILAGEVSSGGPAHPTPKGQFRVLSKDKDKRSRSYTNYFDWPTPMPYAIQFKGPYYIHEGWLPGKAASHGCVRLDYEDARFVFTRIRVGDPVMVVD